jgi:hypothetical protein
MLHANAEYLTYAISSPDGALFQFADRATPAHVEACLVAMLIYSAAQFTREEMRRDDSQIIPLLADVSGLEMTQVMLRRDQLRKAPRSEEWMLYSWLVAAASGLHMTRSLSARSHTATYRTSISIGPRWSARSRNCSRDRPTGERHKQNEGS